MSTVKVSFYASEKLQKKLFSEGKTAQKEQAIDLPVTPELLKLAKMNEGGTLYMNFAVPAGRSYSSPCFKQMTWRQSTGKFNEDGFSLYEATISKEYFTPLFDEIPTEQAILDLFKQPDLSKELADKQAELDAELVERKKEKLQREAEEAERKAKREIDEAKRKAKQEAEETERAAWIAEYGSERLKLMIDENYEYRQTYEQERAAIELPGFKFDSDGIEFRERANPTLKALKALREFKLYNPVIIFVIETEFGGNEYEDSEVKFEAIKVEPAWSRKVLYKEMLTEARP